MACVSVTKRGKRVCHPSHPEIMANFASLASGHQGSNQASNWSSFSCFHVVSFVLWYQAQISFCKGIIMQGLYIVPPQINTSNVVYEIQRSDPHVSSSSA